MKFSIKLQQGRTIHLKSLLFLNTYRGFLEGDPLAISQRLLWEFRNSGPNLSGNKRAWDKLGEGIPAWDNMPRLCINTDWFEEWAKSKFPEIQCCGEFLSYDIARDKSKDASALIVVWFQDDIYPTVSDENLKLLEGIDWERHAFDFEW